MEKGMLKAMLWLSVSPWWLPCVECWEALTLALAAVEGAQALEAMEPSPASLLMPAACNFAQ